MSKVNEYTYEISASGIRAFKRGVQTMERKKTYIDDMDQAFPNGIFTSSSAKIPNLRFREMDKWCQKHGRNPETLTNEELKQFRI